MPSPAIARSLRRIAGARAAARPLPRRPRWLPPAALGAALALLGAPAAQAQQVLQWRQPDGTVAYSALPPSAPARAVRELQLTASSAPTATRPAAAAGDAPVGATPRELRDADAQVARARTALAQAEQAVRSGQEPLPGERQRLVNGHSRLTSAYFDRIAALEAAVARARAALRAAQAQRAALAAD